MLGENVEFYQHVSLLVFNWLSTVASASMKHKNSFKENSVNHIDLLTMVSKINEIELKGS